MKRAKLRQPKPMLRIHSVIPQGFKSFQDEQNIALPTEPGFYFLHGVNELHPELGANAVGKSSLWDAMVWAFFGKTARGTRAKGIANWEQAHVCVVSVDFTAADGTTYLLTRTWSPNSLSLLRHDTGESSGTTQEELNKILRCDYETFLHTVLMSQFGQFFFDKSATEKLNLFSELFDLHYWLDQSKRASAAARDAGSDVADDERELSRIEGELSVQRSTLRKQKKLDKEWSSRRDEAIAEAREEISEAQEAVDEAHAQLLKDRSALKRSQEAEDEAKRKLVELDDFLRDKAQPRARDAQREYRAARKRVQEHDAEYDRVEQLGHGECPTCYSSVDAAHIDSVLSKMVDQGAVLDASVDEAKALSDRQQKALTKATDKRNAAEDRFSSAEERAAAAQQRLQRSRLFHAARETELRSAQAALSRAEDQDNPHSDLIQECKQEISKLKRRERSLTKRIASGTKKKDRAAYWAKRFKDLRLWLIKRTLLDFEVTVNNSLVDLGLSDWKVSFDVERPTASGGVSKGFSVSIESPDSGGPVAWESWSGGETQRLRIAGALGLADLIRNRSSFACELEVWDEPTQHLSPQGVDDLLRYFKGRAREHGKQLWVIDHNTLSAGDFDGSGTMIFDERGSRCEISA